MSATLSKLRVYYFVAFGTLGLYLPFFPSWLQARGFTGFQMSLLVTLLPLCQLLSPSTVGLLADKWGLRGRMMTFCAVTTALGMTGIALGALHSDHLSFVMMWPCMLVFAALRGPSIGLADVLAMEAAENYGRMRLWGSLGFLSMAFLGGQIINTDHAYQLPGLVSAGLWLLVLVSTRLPKSSQLPPRPALHDARELLAQKPYQQLLLTMLLMFGGISAYDLCATLHLTHLGATGTQIGLFWAIATLAEVGLLFFSARFVERLGPGKLLTLACATAAGRWLFSSQATSLPLILLLQPLHGVTFGLMWASAIGVLKRELGTKGTATAHGLFSSAAAVGGTLGLGTWSILFERWGGHRVFLIASCLVALGTLSAARLIRVRGTTAHPLEPDLELITPASGAGPKDLLH